MKTFLLTNDDGIHSEGLRILAQELSQRGQVIIVTPDSEKSGYSHSITTRRELTVKKFDYQLENVVAYTVDGTPVDCLKIGVEHIAARASIDYVFSGINHGYNVGADWYYSGTLGAAREATFYGLPAVAMSMGRDTERNVYPEWTQEHLKQIVPALFKIAFTPGMLLNVNFPVVPLSEVKGIKVVPIDHGQKRFSVLQLTESKKESLYQLKNQIHTVSDNLQADYHYVKQAYITVTPVQIAQTNPTLIEQVNSQLHSANEN